MWPLVLYQAIQSAMSCQRHQPWQRPTISNRLSWDFPRLTWLSPFVCVDNDLNDTGNTTWNSILNVSSGWQRKAAKSNLTMFEIAEAGWLHVALQIGPTTTRLDGHVPFCAAVRRVFSPQSALLDALLTFYYPNRIVSAHTISLVEPAQLNIMWCAL